MSGHPPYDARMTAPSDDPRQGGGDRPPKRLLERPPSERLTTSGAGPAVGAVGRGEVAESEGRPGTPVRATAYGLVAAAAGVAVHLAVASILLWTAGLLVVAVTIGFVVGWAVATGAGTSLRPAPRRSLAAALAVGAVLVAVMLSWGTSGMYLDPLAYAAEVYGLLVPVQLGLAAAGALLGAR